MLSKHFFILFSSFKTGIINVTFKSIPSMIPIQKC